MIHELRYRLGSCALVLATAACVLAQGDEQAGKKPTLPLEPVVMYGASETDRIQHGEVVTAISEARQELHK
jgi:hypothetical protein